LDILESSILSHVRIKLNLGALFALLAHWSKVIKTANIRCMILATLRTLTINPRARLVTIALAIKTIIELASLIVTHGFGHAIA